MTTPDGAGNDDQAEAYKPVRSALDRSEQELVPPAVARPKSVVSSFLLWLVIAGFGFLGSILALTVGDASVRDVLGALLFTALYLLFVFKMRAGRNWARITLAVLGLIAIVGVLSGIRSVGALGLAFSVVQVLLVLGGAYFMFRPDANEYFTANKVPW